MPSQLTPDAVARIAELARLEISPDEGAEFSRQLTAILDYAAIVQQVDTSAVPSIDAAPAAASSGTDAVVTASWREDEAGACLTREDALAAAPDASREHGLFRVPKVI